MVVFTATLVACTLENLGDEEGPVPGAETETQIRFFVEQIAMLMNQRSGYLLLFHLIAACVMIISVAVPDHRG